MVEVWIVGLRGLQYAAGALLLLPHFIVVIAERDGSSVKSEIQSGLRARRISPTFTVEE